jgi:2-keto-4-pentenoate hydratase
MVDGPTDDERIIEGMAAQRALLEGLEREGAALIGYKAGFGAAGALQLLQVPAPLIGFLPDRTLLPMSGDRPTGIDLSGWERPHAEAEVAVRLGRDLTPDMTAEEILASVASVAPAIELADLHIAPAAGEVALILAGDIFHRWLMIGTPVLVDGWAAARPRMTVTHRAADGTETVHRVDDVEAVPGPAIAVLAECARMAPLLGRTPRAGDVVILGSVIPPLPVGPGEEYHVAFEGSAPLAVALEG